MVKTEESEINTGKPRLTWDDLVQMIHTIAVKALVEVKYLSKGQRVGGFQEIRNV